MITTDHANERMLSRFQGCLLGGAMGDALGAPVEFLLAADVHKRFPKGIRHLPSPARITDDTQMTLFGAEAIVRTYDPTHLGSILREEAWLAYQRWLVTQRYGKVGQPWLKAYGLLSQPWLYASRAPGATCLGALSTGKPNMSSKGNGGVMRAAPFGLQLHKTARACFHDAADAAWLTHGHTEGYLPAGALACLIRCVLGGMSYKAACYHTFRVLRDWKGSQETQRMIRVAMGLADAVGPDTPLSTRLRYASTFGTSWTGEVTLGIALFCVLQAIHSGGSFLDAISLAVTHGGDSDTDGAVTGNLAGVLGLEVLPPGWEEKIEGHKVIKAMARKLFDVSVDQTLST